LDSILLDLATRRKRGLKIGLDDGTRMLVVQEGSSERLLGRIGVPLLLLALALLTLARITRLVAKALSYFFNGFLASFEDGCGRDGSAECRDIVAVRRRLALFVAEDCMAVLSIAIQETGNAVLNVDEAILEVVERGNDLIVTVSI
jgi:hypothetical protein